MSEDDDKTYKFVLLTESYEFGEFQTEGVFDSFEEANEYVREELSSSTKYDIRKGRYY